MALPRIKTNAIVLRSADYRDNDRMLTLFSPTLGRADALCRGCRRQNSPLLAGSEIFASGEYVLWQSGDKLTVEACSLQDSFYPLREDWERLTHGMYLLELCLGVIQPEQENERLFLLLLRSLAHLAYGGTPPARVTSVFLMGIVSLMGFRPAVGRCQRCGRPLDTGDKVAGLLSAQAGGVVCRDCAPPDALPLTGSELLYLQGIMRKGLGSLEDPAECTGKVFGGLRALVEERLDVRPRAGEML